MTKTNTFASGLLPDWNKVVTDKAAPQKNHSRLQVVEGGLDDSDTDATNPFPRQVTSKVQRPQAEASKAVGIK